VARRKPLGDLSPAYRRRIERAEAKGLPRAVARGHPEERAGGPGKPDPLVGLQSQRLGHLAARSPQTTKYKVWIVDVDDPDEVIGTITENKLPRYPNGKIIRVGDRWPDPWVSYDRYGKPKEWKVGLVAAITVGRWRLPGSPGGGRYKP
jgi:hypothetical protein